MTENVFKQSEQTENTQVVEDFLAELVGEGKKFPDVQALAKGKWESDNYISTLEKKLDELRKDRDNRQTAQEIADQLRAQLTQAGKSDGESNQGNTNLGEETKDDQKTKGLSQEDLEKLLDERLNQREQQTRAQKNVAEVSQVLREKVGATANKWLQDRATELGVTVEYLQKQAEVSPKAFYNLVGLNAPQQRQGFTPPASSVNTGANLDSGTQVRNNAYYEKLFKEDPKLRFDPKITVQMHKDAMRMGAEKFWNT